MTWSKLYACQSGHSLNNARIILLAASTTKSPNFAIHEAGPGHCQQEPGPVEPPALPVAQELIAPLAAKMVWAMMSLEEKTLPLD